jgi:hypothetical protein
MLNGVTTIIKNPNVDSYISPQVDMLTVASQKVLSSYIKEVYDFVPYVDGGDIQDIYNEYVDYFREDTVELLSLLSETVIGSSELYAEDSIDDDIKIEALVETGKDFFLLNEIAVPALQIADSIAVKAAWDLMPRPAQIAFNAVANATKGNKGIEAAFEAAKKAVKENVNDLAAVNVASGTWKNVLSGKIEAAEAAEALATQTPEPDTIDQIKAALSGAYTSTIGGIQRAYGSSRGGIQQAYGSSKDFVTGTYQDAKEAWDAFNPMKLAQDAQTSTKGLGIPGGLFTVGGAFVILGGGLLTSRLMNRTNKALFKSLYKDVDNFNSRLSTDSQGKLVNAEKKFLIANEKMAQNKKLMSGDEKKKTLINTYRSYFENYFQILGSNPEVSADPKLQNDYDKLYKRYMILDQKISK